MKRSNQLKLLICSLLMAAVPAKVSFRGSVSSGQSSTNQTKPGKVSNTPVQQSGSVSCERGNAVSLGFLDTILLGQKPRYEIIGNQIVIDLPLYVSACVGDISAEAVSNPNDNNIYIRYNMKVDKTAYQAGNGTFEQEYEKCINTMADGNDDFFEVDHLKSKRLIKPHKPITVNIPKIDMNRDSQIVIASPKEDLEYSHAPYGEARVAQSTIFDNAKYNCMAFAKPDTKLVMVNTTRSFDLRQEALAACNGKNLSDIAESLKKLRSDSSGNYDDLTGLLSRIQYSLISEEIDGVVKKMEAIESELYPSEEDIANGEKYGVNKTKRKQLIKDYANLMKEFTKTGDDNSPDSKGYLQILKSELKHLMDEAESLGDSSADETRKEAINESIEKINELIGKFNRQKENEAEYRRLVEAMRESNSQISGKKVLEGIILAQEFSNVKIEGDGKRTLEKAEANSDKEISRLDRNTLAIWGDEAKIRAGDKSPIAQRKKIVQGIQQRAAKDRQKFAQKQSAYDEYIQQYASDLVSSYCTSGGSYEDCMTVRSTYVPYIYNQYMGWKQNNALEYNDYYSNKFGVATSQQSSILNRYNSLYSEYQLNQLQNKFDTQSSYDGGFDLWTGADISTSTGGLSGFNFNLPSLNGSTSNQNSWSNNNNFSIMNNQQRTPSSGSWGNPFQ